MADQPQANEQVVEEKPIDQMDMEELGGVLDKLEVEEQNQPDPGNLTPEDLAAIQAQESKEINEMLQRAPKDAKPEEQETPKEEEAPTEEPAPKANAEPEKPSERFKSKEDAEKSYNALQELLKRQSEELGELRRKKAEPENPPRDTLVPEPKAPEAEDYDFTDKDSVDKYVQAQVSKLMAPVNNKLKSLDERDRQSEAKARDATYRQQIVALGDAYPDMKVEAKEVNGLIATVREAKRMGIEPATLNPKAPVMATILEYVDTVGKSNGVLESLVHAHEAKVSRGGGLKAMLLEAEKKGAKEALSRIKTKRETGANSIVKMKGADTPQQKSMNQMNMKELGSLVDGLPDDML